MEPTKSVEQITSKSTKKDVFARFHVILAASIVSNNQLTHEAPIVADPRLKSIFFCVLTVLVGYAALLLTVKAHPVVVIANR